MSEQFDVVVIGAGPGGYVAAIRAAQLGLKTACIESRKALGGTCLNVGCIPSKALLTSSEKFEEANHQFATHGIKISKMELDLKAMMAHKDQVVSDNTTGIEYLFKKNKITRFEGFGSFKDANTVLVTNGDKKEEIKAKNIIIATGSDVMPLPGIEIDEKQIVSSTGALELKNVPKKMIVIGGGVIGLEMGSVWQRLGAEVTVIEYLDKILPTMDGEISKNMLKIMKKQGLSFELGQKVLSAKASKSGVLLEMEPAKGGDKQTVDADIVLVAIGRRAYTDGLNLEAVGIISDERGRVNINEKWQTNQPHIFAIGDVVKGPMLAHKAEEEGVFVAEVMAGQKPHIDYNLIPGVVYTWPEVAAVGQTEEQLKEAGVEYKVGSFPMRALGRSRASMDLDGLVKVLADKETDEILGVHMVGARAADMIAEAVVAMEYRASAEDVSRMSHAHPTFTEAIKEACLAATDNRPLHM